MSTTINTSSSLLARASQRDELAWQRIVQIYGPLVYAWARRTGLQPQDAADVTQETFAAVAMGLAKFDGHRQGATFRGWLWTVTRNKAADHVRNQQQARSARGGSSNLAILHALSEPVSFSEEQLSEGRQEIVRRALAVMRSDFEPATWQAFWRTVIDGLSPDEVAAELSLSRWSVYKARSRVLHRLRIELDGLETIE